MYISLEVYVIFSIVINIKVEVIGVVFFYFVDDINLVWVIWNMLGIGIDSFKEV